MLKPTLLYFAIIGACLMGQAAAAAPENMVLWVEQELPHFVQDVNVRSLSDGQIAALYGVMNNNESSLETRMRVRSILGGEHVFPLFRNLLR